MSILEAGERAMGADIEQRIDAALDMPALEITDDPEVFTGDEALNKLLILGVAARSWRKDVLIFRQDDRQLHGIPMQTLAVDILGRAATAGLDRVRGDDMTYSPDHSVYDQLFDRISDADHTTFVDKLGAASYAIANLMANNDSFELTVEERQSVRDMRDRLIRAANGLFRSQFLKYANSKNPPEQYAHLLTSIVDPEVASHFVAQDYFIERYLQLTNIDTDRPEVLHEIRYLYWTMEQAKRLQALRIGQIAAK